MRRVRKPVRRPGRSRAALDNRRPTEDPPPAPFRRAPNVRAQKHHPRHRAVAHRRRRLAVFHRLSADGKAAPRRAAQTAGTGASCSRARRSRAPAAARSSAASRRSRPAPAAADAPAACRHAGPRSASSPPRRMSPSTRRGSNGSIDLKGARIDDLALEQYRETIDPHSPPIVLFSPSGAPDAYYAEFGWVPASGTTEKLPGPDTVWTQAGHRRARRRSSGDADLRQRRRALSSAAPSRSTTIICSPSRTRSRTRAAAAVTLFPYALISRHGTPKTLGYYILHEGLIGVMGDRGPAGTRPTRRWSTRRRSTGTPPMPGSASPTNISPRRCCPTPTPRCMRASPSGEAGGQQTYQTDYLLDAADDRAGRDRLGRRAAVRRRQGSLGGRHQFPARHRRRLQPGAPAQPFRSADRLGLVLLHHQADVPCASTSSSIWSAISASPS